MVIPKRVTNPTMDPTDNHPPLSIIAKTPPIRQNGKLSKTIIKLILLFRENLKLIITQIKAKIQLLKRKMVKLQSYSCSYT